MYAVERDRFITEIQRFADEPIMTSHLLKLHHYHRTGEGTMLQAGRWWVRDPMRTLIFFFFFSIYLILPAALDPGVYSASNRNEKQKQKNFLGSRAPPASSLSVIYEPTIQTMWDPQHLTTL
jgi:hypothetical protein